jgi:lactoylglutathione lyase/glyoxylase I family protein
MASPTGSAGTSQGPLATARIRHTALRVPDLEASKRWFVEKLDFRVLGEWTMNEHRCAFLCPAGDDTVHIEIVGGNAPEPNPEFGTLEETLEYGGYHHVCLDVSSLDAALDELRRRGVPVVAEPVVVAAIGRRMAFVADPWGNIVELSETA